MIKNKKGLTVKISYLSLCLVIAFSFLFSIEVKAKEYTEFCVIENDLYSTNSIDRFVGEELTHAVELIGGEPGHKMPNKKIVLRGIESSYTSHTNSDSIALFHFTLNEEGSFCFLEEFEGDDDYYSTSGICNINVRLRNSGSKVNTYMETEQTYYAYRGESFNYRVDLMDSDKDDCGSGGRDVQLFIDGVLYDTQKTNNVGRIYFPIIFDKIGEHTMVFKYSGDSKYGSYRYEQFIWVEEKNKDTNSSQLVSASSQSHDKNKAELDNAKIGKVSGLKVKNRKKRKVLLSWKKVVGVKKYQVKYARNKKFKKSKVIESSKNKATLKGLKKKKTYFFKVRAFGGSNYGAWSVVKKIKIKR